MSTSVDPALQSLLPGVALGTVGRDRLELPLEALQGGETGSGFGDHEGIVLYDVPVRWHERRANCSQGFGLLQLGG